MTRTIIILSITLLLNSCGFNSKENTDLLNKDIENATKVSNSDKVLMYKTIKVATKVIGTSDTNKIEFKEFLANLNELHSLKLSSPTNYSVIDLFNIYKGYKKIKKNIVNVNEDNYRTLTEALLSDSTNIDLKLDRRMLHSYEHGILSIVGFCSRGIGEDVTLYESLNTKSDLIIDLESKSLVQFIQGINYLDKKYNYLAEKEFSKNIMFIELENFPMPITKIITGKDSLNEKDFQKYFLAFNYLMRFVTRDRMTREIDKKNALDDLKKFIEYSKTLKSEDELTLNAELLLYIKLKDYSNAIKIIEKLKLNKKLSSSQVKDYDKMLQLLKANESSNLIEENLNLFNIIISEVRINIQKIDIKELLKKANMEKSISIIKEFDNITSIKKSLEESENIDKNVGTHFSAEPNIVFELR
jgi:hypothetical protein